MNHIQITELNVDDVDAVTGAVQMPALDASALIKQFLAYLKGDITSGGNSTK